MSNENGWIPWDEREDVWKYVVKRFEDEYDDNDNEIYTFFYLGNVPDEYVNEFKKLAQDDDEYESDCEILLFEQLDEQDKIKALKYFVQHKYDLDDTFWWDVRRKLEQQDKDYFEILNKKSIGSNSPVVPASVPADKDSPADNNSAKPKRRKATKKETQDAADLIVNYFNSGKRKFSLSIISNHLENNLGRKFDLSSKTFLGKVYAVLYYQKKNIPPRGWTVGEVEEAEKEVERALKRK